MRLIRHWEARQDSRLHRACFCSDAPSMPDSNPGIIASAQASEKLGMEQIKLAREQTVVQNERQARMDELVGKIAGQQTQIAAENQALAKQQLDYYDTTFKPVERKLVSDAMNFNTEQEQARLAAEAGAAVAGSYDATKEGLRSEMLARGGNVADGKFLDTMSKVGLSQAADTAKAVTAARVQGRELGAAKLQDAASLGRNLSSQAATSYGIATSAGNSAVGNTGAANQNYNAGLSAVNGTASLGVNALNSATNAYNIDNAKKMQAWGAAANQAAQNNANTGSALGTAASLALIAWCDARLKRDVSLLSELPNGLRLYAFRYLWSDDWHTGFLAQEVQAIYPAAVKEDASGFLRLDLGILAACLQGGEVA